MRDRFYFFYSRFGRKGPQFGHQFRFQQTRGFTNRIREFLEKFERSSLPQSHPRYLLQKFSRVGIFSFLDVTLMKEIMKKAPTPLTIGVMVGCNAIYLGNWFQPGLVASLAAVPFNILEGDLWRLVTCCFSHANVLHLSMNSLGWVLLAHALELQLGVLPLLGLTLSCGIVATASQIIAELSTEDKSLGLNRAVIGLSGSVYGLLSFGYFGAKYRPISRLMPRNVRLHSKWMNHSLFRKNGMVLKIMVATPLIGMAINYFMPMLANASHMTGLIYGGVLGLAFRKSRALCIATGVTAPILATAAAFKPVWTKSYQICTAVDAFENRDYQTAAKIFEIFAETDQWAKAMLVFSLVQSPDQRDKARQIAQSIPADKLATKRILYEVRQQIKRKGLQLQRLREEIDALKTLGRLKSVDVNTVARLNQKMTESTNLRREIMMLNVQRLTLFRPWDILAEKRVEGALSTVLALQRDYRKDHEQSS